jgi:phage major head subunit gpT-like protein
MIVNKANLTSLERGFRTVFQNRVRNVTGLRHPEMATRMPSTAKVEEYNWLADLGGMEELLGTANMDGLELVSWTVTNKEWHKTVELPLADIERDNLGIYNSRMEMMADNAAVHPDELLAKALVDGFTATDYTKSANGTACAFFSSVSGRRLFPGASSTLDNKVTGALNATTYNSGMAKLLSMVNGKGKSLNLGRDLRLVVGPANRAAAAVIVEAERNVDGSTNINRGTAKLDVWPQIAATSNVNAWFLYDAGAIYKPMVFQDESPVRFFAVTDPEDSYVVLNKKIINQAYARYNVGYLFPQLIIGGVGS